jgi:hypothetical protein
MRSLRDEVNAECIVKARQNCVLPVVVLKPGRCRAVRIIGNAMAKSLGDSEDLIASVPEPRSLGVCRRQAIGIRLRHSERAAPSAKNTIANAARGSGLPDLRLLMRLAGETKMLHRLAESDFRFLLRALTAWQHDRGVRITLVRLHCRDDGGLGRTAFPRRLSAPLRNAIAAVLSPPVLTDALLAAGPNERSPMCPPKPRSRSQGPLGPSPSCRRQRR